MTGLYSVIYSPAALDDLRLIYKYISEELLEADTAKKQIDRIRSAIKKLDLFPKKYKPVDWEPWQSIGMRQLPVDNFIAFFIVNEEKKNVTVSRIFYGGRNIGEIINE